MDEVLAALDELAFGPLGNRLIMDYFFQRFADPDASSELNQQ